MPWAVRLDQLAWKCLYHAHFNRRAILKRKVGQTDLVSACDEISLVRPCVQDYKSLCAAVMIYATLVNIQTHTHRQIDKQHFGQLIWLAHPAELNAQYWPTLEGRPYASTYLVTLLWPWPWPHNVDTWPWIRYYEDVPKRCLQVKAFKIQNLNSTHRYALLLWPWPRKDDLDVRNDLHYFEYVYLHSKNEFFLGRVFKKLELDHDRRTLHCITCKLHCVPKNVHLFIFQITLSKINRF